MRYGLVVIVAALLFCAAVAGAATSPRSMRFTVGKTGVACSMTSSAVSCQTAGSARTMSATVKPDGNVTICREPQGASPACALGVGGPFAQGFVATPLAQVGGFTCIPLGPFGPAATGAVCTVTATGKGFRISADRIKRISQISPAPHPPCTRAALSAALDRAFHTRSLAPSHLARGWQCVGSFARGDFIDVHGGTGDDITVVFRAAGSTWRLVGRGKVCEDGEIPARIWYFSCAVN